MSGVGTLILGRPRPLPGHRRAGPLTPDYTLDCDEPPKPKLWYSPELPGSIISMSSAVPAARARTPRFVERSSAQSTSAFILGSNYSGSSG